jgi:hypothetical protein
MGKGDRTSCGGRGYFIASAAAVRFSGRLNVFTRDEGYFLRKFRTISPFHFERTLQRHDRLFRTRLCHQDSVREPQALINILYFTYDRTSETKLGLSGHTS